MMFSLTPIGAPLGRAVARLDQHARARRGAGRRVDDADLVVGEADVCELRIEA